MNQVDGLTCSVEVGIPTDRLLLEADNGHKHGNRINRVQPLTQDLVLVSSLSLEDA
ncbi:MAG TPA: hypothetical protein VMP01_04465 [Pirellulaceae bacterium]|nr:hypothetical protein [Pirellulaceae bacterium]